MRRGFTPLRTAAAALAVAAVIQLIPVHRTNPPVRFEVDAPRKVKAILERSCYDCHSNRTKWPWYSRVAPVSWLVARDVHKGRDEVNFSEWPVFDFEKQGHAFEGIAKQIDRRKMPIPMYLLMHEDAKLSEEDRRTLIAWAKELAPPVFDESNPD